MRNDRMLDAAVRPVCKHKVYKFRGRICTVAEIDRCSLKLHYFDRGRELEEIDIRQSRELVPLCG